MSAGRSAPRGFEPVDAKGRGSSPAERAVECLKAYRDRLEDPDAREAALRQEIKRQQALQQDGQAPWRRDIAASEQDLAAAQTRGNDARADQQRLQGAAATMRTAAAGNPAGADAALTRARRLDADAAAAGDRAANADALAATHTATLAQRREMAPTAQIACLRAQLARLEAGHPRTDGCIPPTGEVD